MLWESARELREGAVGFAVSPDGKNVAFAPHKPLDPLPWFQFARKESDPEAEIREIWAMGVEEDNARKVVSLPHGQFLFGVHWSPAGNRLAYIRMEQQRSGTFLFSVESCGLNGESRSVVLSPSDLFIDDFCWLSDGRIVYSTQSSANTRLYSLYETGVESGTGKPSTNPVRLAGPTGALELVSLSATADSKRLVVTKGDGRARVYLAQVSGGGARLSAPRLLTADDSNDWPNAWTVDNRAVLFYSHRNGKFQIFKQDIEKETAEPLVMGHDDAYGPRVSSDGAWVVYGSAPTSWPPGPAKMMRVPIHGGSPQFVMDMFNAKNWNCAARANTCVLLETSKDATQFTMTAFDPIRGKGEIA